jgi:hypothetical protein
MRLHPTLSLSPQVGETPASFCSRVALKHGRTARQFAADCGTEFQAVVDGDPTALQVLFSTCGVDAAWFSGSTVHRIADRQFTIGNELLTRDAMKRSELRVCYKCLATDRLSAEGALSQYMRVEWLVAAVRVCPQHNHPLQAIGADSQKQTHDFAWHLQRHDDSGITASAAAKDAGPLVDYIIDRLRGGRPDHWLNRMPLYAAIKCAEIIGAAANYSIHTPWSSLTEDDWHLAGIAGFELLGGGEDAVASFLRTVQDHHAATETTWGAKRIFGKLYEFLADPSLGIEYEPVRALLRSHIIATFPIPAGEVVLGVKLDRRRLHSVHTAARETGLHPKPLRRKLLAFGVIDDLADHLTDDRLVFDAEGSDDALSSLGSSMSLDGAAEYLNIPRPHDRKLLSLPFIEPVEVPSPRGGHRLAFTRQALDDLMAVLVANVSADEGADDDGEYVWLAQASKQCVRPVRDIVGLLFDGVLTKVRLDPNERGFRSILVNPDELRSLLHPARSTLSLRDVEHRLRVSTRVVKALVELGALPASVEINPVSNLPSRVVQPEEMDKFMETYVSLMELARERGMHFRALSTSLKASEISPAFASDEVPATFYKRSDVAVG